MVTVAGEGLPPDGAAPGGPASPPTTRLVLGATNLLMGPTNFGNLELPEPWRLMPGVSPPEVDRSRDWGGSGWVTAGTADYILRRAEPLLHVELHLRIEPWSSGGRRPAPPSSIPADAGIVELNGHEARMWRGSGTRGLLPRRMVHWARAWIPCQHTGRVLAVELVGACDAAEIDALVPVMEHLGCH